MDERFAQVLTDPRFKTLKRNERKVRVDGRFSQMFTDRRFSSKSDVDPRRGKVVQEEEHVEDHSLKSYYDTSDPTLIATTSRYDVRGNDENDVLSSSSDESSDEDGVEVEHDWAELDRDVPRNSDTSHRLAVCNVDWDRIKAQDLFVLFNSFKPAGSCILSVRIYPSDFGKMRMAEESVRGPAEIVDVPAAAVLTDDEHETGDPVEDEYMQEKLRQYQLNRLRYFYAIVECDSQSTATSLYEQLDNYEFESSASTLDLRFVPDGVLFHEEPEQVCTALPDFSTYKPPIFITSALQQSSVRLTWDETDPSRAQKIESAFASRDEKQLDDLQAFLASEDEEESDSGSDTAPELKSDSVGEDVPIPNKLNKYKMLLQAVEEENGNEDADIEITFDNDDSDDENADQGAEFSAKKDDEDEAAGSDSNIESDGAAVSSEEEGANSPATDSGHGNALHLLVEDAKSHFNFTDFLVDGKKRKKEADADPDFKFDEEDGRFSGIFSSAEYNIDPSNPHFRKTPAMLSLIQRKAHLISQTRPKKKRKESEVAGLVANIKSNTDKFVKQRKRQD